MTTIRLPATITLQNALEYLADLSYGEVESICLIGNELVAVIK